MKREFIEVVFYVRNVFNKVIVFFFSIWVVEKVLEERKEVFSFENNVENNGIRRYWKCNMLSLLF